MLADLVSGSRRLATAIPAIPAIRGGVAGSGIAKVAGIAVAKFPKPNLDPVLGPAVAGYWVTADTTPEAFAAIPVPDPAQCHTPPSEVIRIAGVDGVVIELAGAELVVSGDREALARWSDTVDAWRPRLIEYLASLPSCRTCTHISRRAFDCEGYCGGRDDLPPVYGDTHPLHHLPEDRGASCTAWRLGP